MKVTRQDVDVFYPVTITFETRDELNLMRDVIWYGFTRHMHGQGNGETPKNVAAFADHIRHRICAGNIPRNPAKESD